eukprot:jgi/Botrbrau1/5056/Bobra.37_1s0021.1
MVFTQPFPTCNTKCIVMHHFAGLFYSASLSGIKAPIHLNVNFSILKAPACTGSSQMITLSCVLALRGSGI